MKDKLLQNLIEDYYSKRLDDGCNDLYDDDPLLRFLSDAEKAELKGNFQFVPKLIEFYFL